LKFSRIHVGFGWSIRVGANGRYNRHIFPLGLFCRCKSGVPGPLKFSHTHIGFGWSIRVGANGRYNRHIFPLGLFCRCTSAAQGLRKFSHAHVGFGWSIRIGANGRCNRHIFALASFCQFAPGAQGVVESDGSVAAAGMLKFKSPTVRPLGRGRRAHGRRPGVTPNRPLIEC
jgi:hypothetical protein